MKEKIHSPSLWKYWLDYFEIIERIALWKATQAFRLNRHNHDSEYKLPACPTEQIDVSYTRLAQLQYGQRHQARKLCIPHSSINEGPSIRQTVPVRMWKIPNDNILYLHLENNNHCHQAMCVTGPLLLDEFYNCRFTKMYLSYIKFIWYLFSPQQKRKAMIKCKSSCKLS